MLNGIDECDNYLKIHNIYKYYTVWFVIVASSRIDYKQ